MNLLSYFNMMRETFEDKEKKYINYNPDDLSSYDEKKKEFDKEFSSKKEIKEDPYFRPTKSKKPPPTKVQECYYDVLDINCISGIKISIWILIFMSIFMTICFIWFLLTKVWSSAKRLEPKVKTSLVTKTPSIYIAPEPAQKGPPSFSSRFFGNNTEIKRPVRDATFASRFFGKK